MQPLGQTIKTNCILFQIADQEVCSFWFFIKRFGTSFPTTFSVWIFKKNISYILLTDQILLPEFLYFLRCLQYVYKLYLSFPVCDINFEINLSFLIALFSYMTIKFGTKLKDALSGLRQFLVTETLYQWWKMLFTSP